MPTLSKGSFSLNIGIVKLSGELSQEDRQCAWELYTELSTRVAVIGKPGDPDCTNFNGELYIESLESVYSFFKESRKIMRKYPIGKISLSNRDHLGFLISRIMGNILRPFLEKWQVTFRHWWENHSNPRIAPFERQSEFPKLNEFLNDWSSVRWLMREVKKELIRVYNLVDLESV